MVWFKVDDGFYTSRKVLSIPRRHRLAAVGLWTMAGNWSARELTDGHVPAYVLDELGATETLIQALVEARLWLDHRSVEARPRSDRGSTGIEFHSWADYQPTREDVEAERAKAAERQRKWREKKRDETGDEPVSNGVTNGVTNGVSNGAPTRPDPTRPNKETPKGVSRATRIPDPFLVTSAMREWAAKEVPSLDVDRSTAKFVDYWRGKSGKDATKADWVATWRNWLRRDSEAAPGAKKAVAGGRKIPANEEWMYR